ncbi:MAG: hypothetical protein GWQ05_18515 [Verrucomicrobiaceae bacterium]|nr:hypothetical protein [Verrucomicrobiaceae bacterium]
MNNIVKQVVFLSYLDGNWPCSPAGFSLFWMFNDYAAESAISGFRLVSWIFLFAAMPWNSSPAQLFLPPPVHKEPGPSKRVFVTSPEYVGTSIHHMLYLPPDWQEEDREGWPVIVEFTGNRYPRSGSTGKVEDAGLGYGIGGGKFIWVTLPFVGRDGENAVTWWGDAAATVRYAKTTIPQICARYGGDPNKVLLCGFSRGAIAVNYIGLHDDEIAKLWAGFITHDHYDGVREWGGTAWGTPLNQYRDGAKRRLSRLQGRPVLVCQAGDTVDIRQYLQPRADLGAVTFLDVPVRAIFPSFPNSVAIHPHTDRWLLIPSPARLSVRAWVDRVLDL